MPTYLFAACDGGGVNTLAGAGGVLELMLEPEFRSRYYEFPEGMGGSTHMVMATPGRNALVASSANIPQLFVIPREGDGFAYERFRKIDNLIGLGPPERGTDAQTAMFDFLDEEHVVVQYNRKLVRVALGSGELEVLADIGAFSRKADILHQISVTPRYIIVDEVVGGGFFVYERATHALSFHGDGFPGGHHLVYQDAAGDTVVIRPSFGFQSVEAHLKIDDNVITLYNLTRGTTRTLYYSWEVPNHFPTDMHLQDGHLYVSYAVPGSVCKINLETGRVVARFGARPNLPTRYLSMGMDMVHLFMDYGTMRNRHDTGVSSINALAHAFFMGKHAGTRAGFFAMGFDPEADVLHVCHRGLNRVYCLRKDDLSCLWSCPLPSRGLSSPLFSWWYRSFPYFRRCLGVHHGSLVKM